MPTACVALLSDPASLEPMVPAWEDLAANALEPNPFYEHWLLRPALELLGEGADLCFLAAWNEEGGRRRLGALLPLERLRRYKGLPVRALAAWRHRHGMLCTPLVRADCALPVLSALLRWLRSEGDGAQVLELPCIPADGPFQRALAAALEDSNLPWLAADAYSRGLLLKDRDAQAYLAASLSGDSRKVLRKKARRLRERGALAEVELGAGVDPGRWIEEFLRLEASGWKGRQGGALACSEANRRFATQAFEEAHRRGRLLMLGLDLDGRPIARSCSFLAGAGSFAFKSAFDEAYAEFSPGALAELHRIRRFHELPGVQWMDSYTAANNDKIDRMWKDRRTVQRIAVGAGTWGRLVLSMLPLLRGIKRGLMRKEAEAV